MNFRLIIKAHMRKAIEEIRSEEEAREFIKRNCDPKIDFKGYLSDKLARNDISFSQLLEKSNINKNYGYNIMSGARKNPGRDKVIALCVGAELSCAMAQEALDIAGVGRLYYRSERDVHIAAALNRRIGSVIKLNIILAENGLSPLDT